MGLTTVEIIKAALRRHARETNPFWCTCDWHDEKLLKDSDASGNDAIEAHTQHLAEMIQAALGIKEFVRMENRGTTEQSDSGAP